MIPKQEYPEEFRYLAVVLDLFNREIAGWSIRPGMIRQAGSVLSMRRNWRHNADGLEDEKPG